MYNVLFLCTGNSARSIMAEAILNKVGHRAIPRLFGRVASRGEVNPHALDLLKRLDYDTSAVPLQALG